MPLNYINHLDSVPRPITIGTIGFAQVASDSAKSKKLIIWNGQNTEIMKNRNSREILEIATEIRFQRKENIGLGIL